MLQQHVDWKRGNCPHKLISWADDEERTDRWDDKRDGVKAINIWGKWGHKTLRLEKGDILCVPSLKHRSKRNPPVSVVAKWREVVDKNCRIVVKAPLHCFKAQMACLNLNPIIRLKSAEKTCDPVSKSPFAHRNCGGASQPVSSTFTGVLIPWAHHGLPLCLPPKRELHQITICISFTHHVLPSFLTGILGFSSMSPRGMKLEKSCDGLMYMGSSESSG